MKAVKKDFLDSKLPNLLKKSFNFENQQHKIKTRILTLSLFTIVSIYIPM